MTTGNGFWAERLGWVGRAPITAEREAEIEAANLAYARAESLRLEEASRPLQERQDAIKAELVRTVPADLRRSVLETHAEAERLRFKVSETRRQLEQHLAVEPSEAELDAWLAERFRLENSLPHLQRMSERANAAYSAALETGRRAIKSAVRERSETAAEHLKAFEAAQRQALQAEQLTHRIISQACSAASNFTASDLEAIGGNTANDNHGRKGKV